MKLPNFLIVGAARSGTTSLYYYLQQHPHIGLPKLKEPKYFSSKFLKFPHKGIGDDKVDKYAIKTLDQYKKLFLNLDSYKRVGEASPDYLYYYEYTPLEIRKTLGDIPIIILLRDPTLRAFSAYCYLARDGREKLTFREALAAEEGRLNNNWDFIWGYKKAGLYYQQVKAYLDAFTNVRIILQEHLMNNTEKELKELYTFLGVDESFVANTAIKHNRSGRPSSRFARFILNRDSSISPYVRQFLKAHIPIIVLENISSRFLRRLDLSTDDEIYLRRYFQEDISKLERLIDRDLSHWK